MLIFGIILTVLKLVGVIHVTWLALLVTVCVFWLFWKFVELVSRVLIAGYAINQMGRRRYRSRARRSLRSPLF
jgi:hypothetical protein